MGRASGLRRLRGSPLALLALACAGLPVEPPADPVDVPTSVAPVLRFVGVCDRPAIWWLRREPETEPPTIRYTPVTDSLDLPADPAFTGIRWMELDGAGTPLALGGVPLDSLGAGRVEARCVPVDTAG